MYFYRNWIAFTILILMYFACASAKSQVEDIDKNTSTVFQEELVSSKDLLFLPESACCNLNQSFKGIVVLDKICLTPKQTSLSLHLVEKKKVCVLNEGLIFQDNNSNQYTLIGTVGVDLCPKRRSMLKTPFSLLFPRIKDGFTSFDLIENEKAKYAHNPWAFTSVDVTNCKWY